MARYSRTQRPGGAGGAARGVPPGPPAPPLATLRTRAARARSALLAWLWPGSGTRIPPPLSRSKTVPGSLWLGDHSGIEESGCRSVPEAHRL